MNPKKPIRLFISFLICLSWSCNQAPQTKKSEFVDYLNESDADFDQRMEWWRESRFGMFIHWGVYAVPAGIHKGEKYESIGE